MRTKFFWVAAIVVVAFAAAAVARGSVGGLITGKDIAPDSIRSAHLVDHTIQADDLSTSLVASLRAATGPAGLKGEHGLPGQDAVSAYAFVVPGEVSLNVGPVLVEARSHNIKRVTSRVAGVFCLKPAASINAATRSWSVTPEASRSKAPSSLLFAYADANAGTCPAGEFAVRTYELNITKIGAVALPSEHVAFMVVIP